MSMPREWVDRLFERLAAIYGRGWIGKWEGVDWEAVKSAWAHELRDIGPSGIKYALDNLPENAPNAVEFRRLCAVPPRFYGGEDVPRLPEPPANPEVAKAALEKLKQLRLRRVA